MTTASTRETIVQLLSNMSDGKEIRSYLQRFSSADQSQFAVIKIGGAILRDQLEETAAALGFLHSVGLTPIVLHGGGPQMDERLAAENITSKKIDGLRVTSGPVLDIAREVFTAENIRLVEAIRAHGYSAQSLPVGAIEAEYLDKDKFGFVGEPSHVKLDQIRSAVSSGAIPILTCLGISPGGQILNMNGDSATRALVDALQPMKIVFLSSVGGLLDANGATIHSINLASDFDGLMKAPWVEGGMRLKIQEIKRLLDAAPLSSSVSITTPSGLVKELFTHSGSGTLVRMGETVSFVDSKAAIDATKLTDLIENAFGQKLNADWWDKVDFQGAHVSKTYRAGAVVSRINDFTYLDKFAVLEDARGEGLARTVWRALRKDNESFFWRSRTANGFNAFYHNSADGSLKSGPWTIFWVGEKDLTRIGKAAEHIAQMPPSFRDEVDE